MNDIRNNVIVSIIGSGLMGHGIALDFALSGFKVYLNDVSKEKIDLGIIQISETIDYLSRSRNLDKKKNLKKYLSRGKFTISIARFKHCVRGCIRGFRFKKRYI